MAQKARLSGRIPAIPGAGTATGPQGIVVKFQSFRGLLEF
jgi:hypothetical protein